MSLNKLWRAGLLRLAIGALALAMLGSQAALAGSGGPAVDAVGGAEESAPTDRLIVKYHQGVAGTDATATAADRAQLHRAAQETARAHGVQLRLLRLGAFDTHVMKLDRRLSHAEVLQLARDIATRDPNVEYAEPDRILQAQLTPNDTQFGQQWHYFEPAGGLNLPPAWDKSTGTGVVVAVIDTGFRPHVDLAPNILPGFDMINNTFVSNDGSGRDSDARDPGDAVRAGECGGGQPVQDQPSSWHGTHVAGTIAAVSNNGSGVAGVAFNAKVLPVRVLGKCGGFTSDIADGMVWASGGQVAGLPANPNPARVINLSLGGSGACDITSQNAINSARSRNTVVVVAAGNSNANAANFTPASCAGVITVAAIDRSGGRAFYSNFGANVAVAAPGGDMRASISNGILSTLNNGATSPGADAFAFYQGTSMATPHVSGVVALMLARTPALTPDDVKARLQSSARAFPAACSQCGAGIVDASAAVDAAVGSQPPPNRITVRAHASLAANVGPLMQVLVAGASVGTVEVRSATPADHVFALPAAVRPGARVDVVFTNDGANGTEDRNLFVDSLTVNGATLLPTDPGVTVDIGSGAAAFDGVNVIPGRSGILWNAALRFFAPDNSAPKVTVRARASLAANVGPLMTLFVGGTAVSSVEVRSTTFADHVFTLSAPVAPNTRVDVVFSNDGSNGTEDRNLFVESLTVNGATLLPTDPGVTVDVGSGAAAFDGVNVIPGRSGILWNAALRFIAP
ncbi:MAG TPA: S8 family serine peptidase [Burkholderiaceae bacterium]|nr:S8 family serine peptidase [Burkholderiaceae bacterium]